MPQHGVYFRQYIQPFLAGSRLFFLLRTGHYAALVVTHSFCNYMGFPDFGAVANHPRSKELIVAFLGGILGFIVLLKPLTSPSLYGFPSTESSGYVIFFK